MQQQLARIKRINEIKQQIKDIDSGKMPNSAVRRRNPANQNQAQARNRNSDWVVLRPDELGYGMGANARRWVKTGGFDFGKSLTYKLDSDLQNVKNLLASYNHDGMTYQQEIDLMKAASAYIAKYSTGKKASHKKRTELMEEILFQLTMQGGTKDAADANIKNAKTKVYLNPYSAQQTWDIAGAKDEEEREKYRNKKYDDYKDTIRNYNKAKGNIDNLKNVYHDKKFSKSLQMIAADVISRSGAISKIVPKPGGGFRDTDEGYEIDSRINQGTNENLVSTFHEFTHLADSEAFENAMAAAVSPDATDEEIRKLVIENSKKASKLYGLHHDIGVYHYQAGNNQFEKYVSGSDRKNALLESQGGGPRGPEYLRKQKKGTEAIKRLFPNGMLRGIKPGKIQGFQTLNEYDAVTNELLLKYELSHPEEERNNSQEYRLLKSYAIDAHVRRRIADLKKRMKQKV